MLTLINKLKNFEGIKELFTNTITQKTIKVFIIQSLGLLFAFLSNIWIAKLLNIEEYGEYSYIITLINLLSSIACLGFSSLLIREIPIFQEQKKISFTKGLIKYSFNTSLLFSLVFSILILLSGIINSNILKFNTSILICISISIPFSSLLLIRQYTLQGLSHSSYSQLVNNLIKYIIVIGLIAFFTFFINSSINLSLIIIITACSFIISFFLLEVLLKKVSREISVVKTDYQSSVWLRTALLLLAFKLITLLISSSEIFFLEYFKNNEEVGIYSMSKKIAGITSFGLAAANIVLAPRISLLFSQGKLTELQSFIKRSMQLLFFFSLLLSIILTLFSFPLFDYLGSDYKNSFLPLIIMIIGELLNIAFGPVANLLISIKQESTVNKTMFITLLFNIISNLILIPIFGYIGAALTTTLTMLCWNLLMAIQVRKKSGIKSWIW